MTSDEAYELLREYHEQIRKIERAGKQYRQIFKLSAGKSPDIAVFVIDNFATTINELSAHLDFMRRAFALLIKDFDDYDA